MVGSKMIFTFEKGSGSMNSSQVLKRSTRL